MNPSAWLRAVVTLYPPNPELSSLYLIDLAQRLEFHFRSRVSEKGLRRYMGHCGVLQ
jgi:hypothetical protein